MNALFIYPNVKLFSLMWSLNILGNIISEFLSTKNTGYHMHSLYQLVPYKKGWWRILSTPHPADAPHANPHDWAHMAIRAMHLYVVESYCHLSWCTVRCWHSGDEPTLERDQHKAMGIKSHLVFDEWVNFHHSPSPLCGFISLPASRHNIFFTKHISTLHPYL